MVAGQVSAAGPDEAPAIDSLRRLVIGNKKDQLIPLGELADLKYVSGASRIYRDLPARWKRPPPVPGVWLFSAIL